MRYSYHYYNWNTGGKYLLSSFPSLCAPESRRFPSVTVSTENCFFCFLHPPKQTHGFRTLKREQQVCLSPQQGVSWAQAEQTHNTMPQTLLEAGKNPFFSQNTLQCLNLSWFKLLTSKLCCPGTHIFLLLWMPEYSIFGPKKVSYLLLR